MNIRHITWFEARMSSICGRKLFAFCFVHSIIITKKTTLPFKCVRFVKGHSRNRTKAIHRAMTIKWILNFISMPVIVSSSLHLMSIKHFVHYWSIMSVYDMICYICMSQMNSSSFESSIAWIVYVCMIYSND